MPIYIVHCYTGSSDLGRYNWYCYNANSPIVLIVSVLSQFRALLFKATKSATMNIFRFFLFCF